MWSAFCHSECSTMANNLYGYALGMVVLSTVFGLYNIAVHDHHHGRTDLPYMHIRAKPYPWSCSDCNLFDGECWAQCRAAKNA